MAKQNFGSAAIKNVGDTRVAMFPVAEFSGTRVSDKAFIRCENVTITIEDIFAAYLAERDNVELVQFIDKQVGELRVFLDDLERRITPAFVAKEEVKP